MSTVLAAINELSNQVLKMDTDMTREIKEIKVEMVKLKRDVHKTRIMSGSLVEANIRSYFMKEYGESFSRQYTAIDLAGLIYLATPRELRKNSSGYHTLLERRSIFVKEIYKSKASSFLFDYLLERKLDDDVVTDDMPAMQMKLIEFSKDVTNSSKKSTIDSFAKVLENMMICKTDHKAMMNELDQACSDKSTRSFVFALITSMIVNACDKAVPPLKLLPERIWNDKQLEFDLRGQCEVKRSVSGSKTVVVRTGEVKSTLTGISKAKALSQLVVRSLTVALVAVLCDEEIDLIEVDCLLVAFNPSKSFDRSHTLNFSLGSDKKPRNATAILRFTSLVPPNTSGLKDLDDKEDETVDGEMSS